MVPVTCGSITKASSILNQLDNNEMRSTGALTLLIGAISIYSVSAKYVQNPFMDNIGPVMPPAASDPSASTPPEGGSVILCDVLGRDRSINIFAGFTRDIEAISKRLSDGQQNTTVLAPLNSAITGLPRKPWESNEDYNRLGADAYEGKPGEDRAHANLRQFVEEHIVPESPWPEGAKMKTLGGTEVWWETKDGKRIVQPGNIEVTSVASKVANGQAWILKGARNYA
ncbi:hypothetical protein V499_02232 [Pseudogymnoascus sp. VKM F-103]|nr:hypothetical protein V499_02232 [Pseudogymnoascus sp. VKM F-103]